MKCSKCGKTFDEESLFCSGCGLKVSESKAIIEMQKKEKREKSKTIEKRMSIFTVVKERVHNVTAFQWKLIVSSMIAAVLLVTGSIGYAYVSAGDRRDPVQTVKLYLKATLTGNQDIINTFRDPEEVEHEYQLLYAGRTGDNLKEIQQKQQHLFDLQKENNKSYYFYDFHATPKSEKECIVDYRQIQPEDNGNSVESKLTVIKRGFKYYVRLK